MDVVIEPYSDVFAPALAALVVEAWRPVFARTAAEVPGFVYDTFYPDGWEPRPVARYFKRV